MSEPRVIVLCSSRLALPSIQQLAFFKQLAVVVIPVEYKEMIRDTRTVLTGMGIPVLPLPEKTWKKKITEAIRTHAVDTGLMLSFSYKLPVALYQLTTRGFYNVHPGPLPAYRGPDPVFQQIRNKEKTAEVTVHKVDKDYNTGPVVVSEKIKLHPDDTYGMLNEKLSYTAARLTGTLLKLLSFDLAIPSRAQDESKAIYYKKQVAADVSINWRVMDADSIIALINAGNPWNKGAFTRLKNKIIRFMEAFIAEWPEQELPAAGTIMAIDERGLLVAALNNKVVCVQLIYTDEGFLMAKRLKQFGVMPGNRFDMI